jgi:hypothetical protein
MVTDAIFHDVEISHSDGENKFGFWMRDENNQHEFDLKISIS